MGDAVSPNDIAVVLRHAGYNENRNNPVGYYTLRPGFDRDFPRRRILFRSGRRGREFARGKIARIVSLGDNSDRPMYELEPQLITNLNDRKREKQRVVRYEDIPAPLRNAILSAEDKRFFSTPASIPSA